MPGSAHSGFPEGNATVDRQRLRSQCRHARLRLGTSRRLASGRTLREWELVAYDKEIEIVPEETRVAQVTFNDAFVGFRQSQRELRPGDAERITVSYPWIRGESYEVEVMTSTGATVAYDLEEAEAGPRSASA